MYRFLVIDDEFYVRQRVRLCIPWEEYGFSFAGEASGAAEASEFIKSNEVHLAIVDISMPGISGLEFIKICRAACPNMKIIILSGFGTFEYAKQAIAYGVTSYLVKPIDTEELVKALTEIRDMLDNDAIIRKERQIWQQAKTVEEAVSRDAFFRSLLVDHVITSGREEEKLLARYLSPDTRYFVIVLEIPVEQGISPQLQAQRRESARSIVAGIASRFCDSLPTIDIYGHPVLICLDTLCEEEQLLIMKEAISVVPDMLHANMIYGYGNAHAGNVEGIAKAYKEALYFLTFKTIYGVGQNPYDALIPDKSDWSRLGVLRERIKNLLDAGERIGVEVGIGHIFSYMSKRLFCLQALETELSNLLTIGINYASVKELPFFIAENDWILYSCSEITHSGKTLLEVEQKIVELFFALIEEPRNAEVPMIDRLVDEAARLIDRDFCRCDMGLQWISSTLLISPAYLSRSFKRLQGMTVSQYIIKCRMERAQELLKQTGMSTTQVAEEVGYRDVFYFSKCFKKYFGVSPSQYGIL